jgi:hypothetical protein
MQALRVAALGLTVAICLGLAAPLALADDVWVPTGRSVARDQGSWTLRDPGEWIAAWLERVAERLGSPKAPRAVVASVCCGLDPSGTPCSPCPTAGTPTSPDR